MRIKNIIVGATLLALTASCSTPRNVTYFQDVCKSETSEMAITKPVEITLRPKDKISIIVNSPDLRLTNLFNLPIVSQQIGTETGGNTNRGMSGYTLDSDGCIDFPVLGKIKVEGMTREQVAEYIKNQLVSNDYVKDPVVTVEFQNLGVSVMGEVAKPGRYNIIKDNITILDAISMAGDLTIYGERNNVMVLRTEGDKQKAYTVDLTSAENFYGSPVYYLQQDDVVYVTPNDTKIRQSTVNGNNVRSTSFWISLTSLLTSVAILFFR